MDIISHGTECPDISILLVTYNHERYVEQAIRSILMQEGAFTAEIVVADDASTDRTQDILDQYVGLIRMLGQETNVGVGENIRQGIAACRGEYVAFLEGDDFWTSTKKLQMQLNHMQEHPNHSLVHHLVRYYDDVSGQYVREFPPEDRRQNYHNGMLLANGNFIQTCALMCRAAALRKVPSIVYSFTAIDWPLCALMTQEMGIGFIYHDMSVYRIHASGVWSSSSKMRKIVEARKMAAMMYRVSLAYQRKAWLSLYRWALIQQCSHEDWGDAKCYYGSSWRELLSESMRMNYHDPIWLIRTLLRSSVRGIRSVLQSTIAK